MSIESELKECFAQALKEEKKGMKHKGLLIIKPSTEKAKEYIEKAKESLSFCEFYKQKGADYKIPEEWFYTLYYCGLAVLSMFGIESRSQKYTALFLKYVQEKDLIEFDKEFIERIMVHKEKEKESDVDKREEARYSSWIKNKEVGIIYADMMNMCRKAIYQAENIIFSKKTFKVPKELVP